MSTPSVSHHRLLKKPGASTDTEILFSDLSLCVQCTGKPVPLVTVEGDRRVSEATVWNGSQCCLVKDGTKKYSSYGVCHSYYKLNYISKIGSKPNTLTDIGGDTVVLLNKHLGFTGDYLRQYWN